MTKAIHLYGAVLLLLAGQAVIGFEERKAAKYFNVCVETFGSYDELSPRAIASTVHSCNGDN